MDFTKGKLYCDELLQGVDEESIIKKYKIDSIELYNVVDNFNPDISRKYLKHFCGMYINYVCLGWPGADEAVCSAYGYELQCPLKKNRN